LKILSVGDSVVV